MTEQQWDKKLKIKTSGRDDVHSDEYHYPYEPTPYSVLERLAESGYIERENIVVDYGCGKGRVGFFLNSQIGCDVFGIEYNEKIFAIAEQNKGTFRGKSRIHFVCKNAGEFEIINADCFYFFNPFSVEILRSVLGKIIDSYYRNPRNMKLFFYYPNDEYLSELMAQDELMFLDEIDCRDLFEGSNERERILIFEL